MKNTELKLIDKYLFDEVSENEKSIVKALIDSSPDNQEAFNQYNRLIKSIKPVEPPQIPDASIVWSRLQGSTLSKDIKTENVYDLTSGERKSSSLKYYWTAAAAVLLIVSGLLIRNNLYLNDISVKTAYAEQKEIILPDNSSVFLNAGSELVYPEDFSGEARVVRLSGEAYFTVVKGVKPFIIETQYAEISVLGTAFDVLSRYDRTEVTVTEGLVNVSPVANPSSSVNLFVDQHVKVTESGILDSVQTVDAEYMLGWLDDRFVFHRTPLAEAVDELQRRYNANIIISDPDLMKMTLSGSYAAKGIDSTLASFCLALNLKLYKKDQSYLIAK